MHERVQSVVGSISSTIGNGEVFFRTKLSWMEKYRSRFLSMPHVDSMPVRSLVCPVRQKRMRPAFSLRQSSFRTNLLSKVFMEERIKQRTGYDENSISCDEFNDNVLLHTRFKQSCSLSSSLPHQVLGNPRVHQNTPFSENGNSLKADRTILFP